MTDCAILWMDKISEYSGCLLQSLQINYGSGIVMKTNQFEFKAATYLRLSKDDGDFSLSNSGKAESNSIYNQRELLKNFLRSHPDIHHVAEYVDDGYTGTNFERPDFKRMMDDIYAGKINCVIVKDLSRFGRDYIDTGRYIEKIFPQLEIRFISVNDQLDTNESHSSDNIIVPFKNLINDSYSRDTSIKVRSSLEVKRQKGEFVSGFTVYGYKKDPQNKNHLVIDEYAADIVREIFSLAMEGYSPEAIASCLNAKGILCPLEYKKSNGSRFKCSFKTSNQPSWSHVAVRRILTNEVYTGVLVQGKRTTPNYKVKRIIYKDKEQWARMEGTHEAIIPRPLFDLIQQLLKEDTRIAPDEEKIYPYSGKIFCGDCKSVITRKTAKSGNKTYVYYICSANKADRNVCSKHSIRQEDLDEAILATIQGQIKVILDLDKAMQQVEALSWERSEIHKIDASMAVQYQIIEKNNELRMNVYEDLREGIIDKAEFAELKEEFSQRIADAKQALEKLQISKNEIQHGFSAQQSWLSQFREYQNITEVTRAVVVNLIEKIFIYENNEIEVIFRHRDQLADIMAFIQNQQSTKAQSMTFILPERKVI